MYRCVDFRNPINIFPENIFQNLRQIRKGLPRTSKIGLHIPLMVRVPQIATTAHNKKLHFELIVVQI